MKYPKRFLFLCCISIITTIFYLLYGSSYSTALQSIPIPFTLLFLSDVIPFSLSSHVKRSKKFSTINLNDSQPLFQSRFYSDYPYLPIHIYTQNLTSLKNISKLILLGNGIFGDRKWGLSSIGQSSTNLMTELSCPFLSNYCEVTDNKTLFSEADAVVYHMRDDINLREARRYRQPEQRFVFALWESPSHTPNLKSYKKFFNWTMTYRFKSHIIAPYYSSNAYIHTSSDYYKFLIKENATKNLNLQFQKPIYRPSDSILEEKKLGTIAALISNPGGSSGRLMFIKHLKRYIDIKVYGRQGEPCPTSVNCMEFISKNYYFFLSFENSLCRDYTTEKFFTPIKYPIVPIVLGRTNYSYFIPSSGFIDTNDYTNLSSLAQYIKEIRQDKEKYLSFFSWKENYVWGISGFLTPLCDLCLRLHLDSKPNVIDDINAWWNDDACTRPRKFKRL
ncbi:unnamed protein product [Adineta steineri]|uniref:Fucosyltransferase n=1 Tax=Adineta steineri TaxID=433720 RepID=A0A815G5U4_9BILA|nr:unnamed protein product [Adineta steineri]